MNSHVKSIGNLQPLMLGLNWSVSIRQLVIDRLLDTYEDISPLEPFKTYDLPTPYNSFGAGEALMQAMKSADNGG